MNPQKQARRDFYEQVEIDNDEEITNEEKLYFAKIHEYDLSSVLDRLQLFVNMFFIAEICHRLSKNFRPSEDFIQIPSYVQEKTDGNGNKTYTYQIQLYSI